MRRLVPGGRLQAGFTVLEMMVVVAIIALLAAFALPRLLHAMNTGRGSPGLVDEIAIAAALEQYFTDNARFPYDTNANNIMGALRGPYLKLSPTFRNGFNQGYLYLTSETGRGFWLIDLRGETQDDSSDPGQQIQVKCVAAAGAEEVRTFTVQQGPNAALTIPAVPPAAAMWVSDDKIDNCFLVNPNPNIKLMTHFR